MQMKTYYEDFSLSNLQGSYNNSLEDVISYSQDKYINSSEYKKNRAKVEDLINKLKELFPEASGIIKELDESFFGIECICYSAAYRDGMGDLMAAMTLSRLNIINCECIVEKRCKK